MLLLPKKSMGQTPSKIYRKSTLSLWLKQKLKSLLNIKERTCRMYCKLHLGTKQTSTSSKEEVENTDTLAILLKNNYSILFYMLKMRLYLN